MREFDDRETISAPVEMMPVPVKGIRVYGTDRTVWFSGARERFTIGSGRCDLRLEDPCVSGHHCTLVWRSPTQVVVRDERSKNGTFVNGNRIEVAEARAGATMALGNTTLLMLASRAARERSAIEQLVGRSAALRAAVDTAVRAGRGDCHVLILGETGTGKELIARAVHESSRRSLQPFVPVNCGGIPRDLVASELFGHEKGAFTGAVSERDGVFVQADRGTLFLDEIGELPLASQPHLLRALEARRVRRVGGATERAVDCNVVAATHQRSGALREDLYHRLATVVIELPPLRDRLEDVPLLVEAFAKELEPTYGPREVSKNAVLRLQAYHWPGNVRELRHATHRACALGTGRLELEDFLPPNLRQEAGDRGAPRPATYDAVLCEIIKDALEREGSIRRAARALGIPRSTLADRARKYGLRAPNARR